VYDRLFDKPVLVQLPGEAKVRSIKSVGHAADLLFDKWPIDTPLAADARAACLMAGIGPQDTVRARTAFESAAIEAKIFIG
jgi:hypothetical protein